MLPIDINAHGTILGSEGYLIGERISVDETMLAIRLLLKEIEDKQMPPPPIQFGLTVYLAN